MKSLMLIPARAGSKRLPRKNILPLGGRPLIEWTIEQAAASQAGSIFVSTDSLEIATIARRSGAEVPFLRPPELAADDASSSSVLEHTLSWIKTNLQIVPEISVLLQPTSPFRSSNDILESIHLLENSGAPAVISVCPARTHPWLALQCKPDGLLKYFCDVMPPVERTQKNPPAYEFNGAIYAIRSDIFLDKKTFFPEGTRALVMPSCRSLDIDTTEDFLFAEWLIARK
jgi:CMP-N-acetylneuraminic acid synthetase